MKQKKERADLEQRVRKIASLSTTLAEIHNILPSEPSGAAKNPAPPDY